MSSATVGCFPVLPSSHPPLYPSPRASLARVLTLTLAHGGTQDLLKVHAALLEPALADRFNRKAWERSVRGAADLAALRDALGELQAAVKDYRLSQSFTRTPLLVKGAWLPTGTP